MARGRKGKCDFKVLGASYAQLDSDAMQEFVKCGADATTLRRVRGHHLTPFGTAPSLVASRRSAEARAQVARRAIVDLPTQDGLPQRLAIANNAVSVAPSPSYIADTVSKVRSVHRALNASRAKAEALRQDQLDSYRSSQGERDVEMVMDAVPALKNLGITLEPTPMARHLGFNVAFDSDRLMKAGMSALGCEARSGNLAGAVDQYATEASKVIESKDCRNCPPAVALTRCMKFRICTCPGSDTYPVWLFRQVVHVCLKKQFPASKPSRRQLLQDGFVVLRFLRDACPTASSSSSSTSAVDSADEVWYHVSLQYLSPYKSTFQLVRPASPPPGEEATDTLRFIQASSIVFIELTSFNTSVCCIMLSHDFICLS